MTTKTPSWNDIRKRATAFASEWASATDERAQSQLFWVEFFAIFSIDFKRVAQFEAHARRVTTGNRGRIDVFWPRVLLCEHKSAGKDLAQAEHQALDYLDSIDASEQPKAIITSDFANIRLLDLANGGEAITIKTTDLAKEIERFGFIIGYKKPTFRNEDEANVQAARLMGKLYEELSKDGYEGHEASILLTRLLFLLFGDDTGMWQRGLFAEFVAERTNADGSDLGPQLSLLFQELDKPEIKRSQALDDYLKRFPYVNGGLFKERLDIPTFDRRMRDQLLEACGFDWGNISPAIFGSLFQTIKDRSSRRELGEHYTPEKFILRTIGPLFLDDLANEVQASKDNAQKLKKIRERLRKQSYLDPACGCGNFLIVAYKHLRKIELDILVHLDRLNKSETQLTTDPTLGLAVSLNQFTGIEIEEWPARIAETAMFLADHQANLDLAAVFGETPDRLPITQSANIFIDNALQVDWKQVAKLNDDSFIFGNPPFGGSTWQNQSQKDDTAKVWGNISGSGLVDYVTNWFVLSAQNVLNTKAKIALVSTNSISQGTQPATLWGTLNDLGFGIDFAHQSFNWSSDAPGQAGVHVVIIGFSSTKDSSKKSLWSYSKNQESTHQLVENINAYLLNAPNILITKRRSPLQSETPLMDNGNKPTDDGMLSDLSDEEHLKIQTDDPIAAKYLRQLVGAQELLNGKTRWCLWLTDATPEEIRQSPQLRQRCEHVQAFRKSSNKVQTQKDAITPHLFQEIRQPKDDFIAIPRITSENRSYVPMVIFSKEIIINDKLSYIANGEKWLLALLSSRVFNVWNKAISGRTRNDTLISNTITYNNFPFPVLNIESKAKLYSLCEAVLLGRSEHASTSLADLYDPVSMPKALAEAHAALDSAVLKIYGLSNSTTDNEILRELFSRYKELVVDGQLELSAKPAKKRTKRSSN